jgi:anti-sigma factor RsiW
MIACPDKEHLLQALIDGELDARNAQAAEEHLRACPGCAEAFAELQMLRERLSAPDVAWRAPEGLRERIEAQLAAPPAPAVTRRSRALAPWLVSGGMTALAAGLALALVWPNPRALEDELVADHVRSTLASHLVDVETSDRHTVKPWFNGRIDFAPPVPDLADRGYPLAGGRLDYVRDRPVAALVYRRNKHVINLFIWPSKPGTSLPPAKALRQGYALEHWESGGLEFWAVSDVDPADLAAFRAAFTAATAPHNAA